MTPTSSLFSPPAHYSAQTDHCSQAHWSVQGGPVNEPRIPCPCRFCGRINIGTKHKERLNYDDVCAQCRDPHEPRTVLVPGFERVA